MIPKTATHKGIVAGRVIYYRKRQVPIKHPRFGAIEWELYRVDIGSWVSAHFPPVDNMEVI